MIPDRLMGPAEWAHLAWQKHTEGVAITVPVTALATLLVHAYELSGAKVALEQKLKITIETTGEESPEQ